MTMVDRLGARRLSRSAAPSIRSPPCRPLDGPVVVPDRPEHRRVGAVHVRPVADDPAPSVSGTSESARRGQCDPHDGADPFGVLRVHQAEHPPVRSRCARPRLLTASGIVEVVDGVHRFTVPAAPGAGRRRSSAGTTRWVREGSVTGLSADGRSVAGSQQQASHRPLTGLSSSIPAGTVPTRQPVPCRCAHPPPARPVAQTSIGINGGVLLVSVLLAISLAQGVAAEHRALPPHQRLLVRRRPERGRVPGVVGRPTSWGHYIQPGDAVAEITLWFFGGVAKLEGRGRAWGEFGSRRQAGDEHGDRCAGRGLSAWESTSLDGSRCCSACWSGCRPST